MDANKNELIELISDELVVSKKNAKLIIEKVSAGVIALTKLHGSLRISGLGRFQSIETAPRLGRNPRTGEEATIAPGYRVTFRAAERFKKCLNSDET
jgi:nucleoid DNA-binding protein